MSILDDLRWAAAEVVKPAGQTKLPPAPKSDEQREAEKMIVLELMNSDERDKSQRLAASLFRKAGKS